MKDLTNYFHISGLIAKEIPGSINQAEKDELNE